MKVETNHYANSCIESNPSCRAWSDTPVEELKAFVGVLILMGIVRLPDAFETQIQKVDKADLTVF